MKAKELHAILSGATASQMVGQCLETIKWPDAAQARSFFELTRLKNKPVPLDILAYYLGKNDSVTHILFQGAEQFQFMNLLINVQGRIRKAIDLSPAEKSIIAATAVQGSKSPPPQTGWEDDEDDEDDAQDAIPDTETTF